MKLPPITDPAEILAAAFASTSRAIEAVRSEAHADVAVGQTYRASGVLRRVESIEAAFRSDLRRLSVRCEVLASAAKNT